jgi:asparagine synthetase B (glutamine-hydrolysing)
VKTQEEPTISTGPYAQYQVMRRRTRKWKVLLDGQGADEMMAGLHAVLFRLPSPDDEPVNSKGSWCGKCSHPLTFF